MLGDHCKRTNRFVPLERIVERNICDRSAESVRGVRGVINLISVKPAVTAASCKNGTEAASRRAAELDARNVQVAQIAASSWHRSAPLFPDEDLWDSAPGSWSRSKALSNDL